MTDIFLNLVNMSLTACWLILAVVLLRLIFRRAPRWVFCLLWGFVGLRLVIPFSFESIFSLIPTKTPVKEVNEVVNRVIVDSGRPMTELPLNQAPVVTPSVPVTPGATSPVPPAVTAPAADKALSLAEIFAIVWICGIAVLLVYAAVSYLLLRYKIRTATRLESNVWQSEAVSSPFVLGFIKPRIYLPYALDALDIPYVLSHERAHISRRDHLIKPLGFVILAVYWFNPVIWLAYILLCRDVELACDEKVIKTLGKDERRDYSTALLNCSVSRVRIAACPIAFGEVAVKERIKGVMNYKKPAFWIIILAVIAIIITAVCFLTDPKSKDEDDDVKQNEKEEKEELYASIDISNISYESDSEEIEIELINESIAKIAPIMEIDFINNSYQIVYVPSNYILYYNDGGGWTECEGRADYNSGEKHEVDDGDRVRLIRNLEYFDMTKPGQYCLWQEFYYRSYTAEVETMYARVFFEISDGVIDPIDESELTDTDLYGYAYWLTEYLRMPNSVGGEYSIVNGLYLAARYSYENDMPFVKKNETDFRISRSDLCAMYSVLTGVDTNVGVILDGCHQYLELFGDSYDYDKDEYIFTLDRNGWGENEFIDGNFGMECRSYSLDPENPPQVNEDYNDVSVTVWIEHPQDISETNKIYYEAKLVFEKEAIYGRIIYRIRSVYYSETPEDREANVSVSGLARDPETGVFTEFMLHTDKGQTVFTGKAIENSENQPYVSSIYQYDYTGDGVKDISVFLNTKEYNRNNMCQEKEVHVFDGETLTEIPGLKNIPQKIQDSLDLSFDGETYTIGVNGDEYYVKRKWYEDMNESEFYDLPSFTERYEITVDHSGHILFSLYCTVKTRDERYDTLNVSMMYLNGEFVVGGIDADKFFYYHKGCSVHDDFFHQLNISTEDDVEDWFREVDACGYNNDGCYNPFNIVNYAKRYGISGQQLRDEYYMSYQYSNYYVEDSSPLFELDEEGCDEFFRNIDKLTDEQKNLLKKRNTEFRFKKEFVEQLRYSKDLSKRKAFYKFTNNGKNNRLYAWSIPELVYEAGLTLEEVETAYAEFFKRERHPIFEYDFARLFTEREYFEELIETAEYPVFVDEALRK